VRLPRSTIAATTVTTRSATTPAMPSSPAAIVPTLAGRHTRRTESKVGSVRGCRAMTTGSG
jgi:hypothetical protein